MWRWCKSAFRNSRRYWKYGLLFTVIVSVIELIRIFLVKNVTLCTIPREEITTTTMRPPDNFSYPHEADFARLLEDIEANRPIYLEPNNIHGFNYISNPDNICNVKNIHKKKNPFFLLILIKSSRDNFHLRQTIRWRTKHKTFKKWRRRVRIVFLLGYSFNETNDDLSKESAMFKDIVQEDFLDSYRNLTYKTVMGYRWATRYCPIATHILYQDDDFHFNVENVFSYLRQQANPDSVYIGYYINDSPPDRHNTSKYFMSYDDYPHRYYPPYFPGGAYFVSMNIAQKFVKVFPYVKHMAIDDVFLGIVAYKLNVTLYHSDLIAFNGCENFTEIISCRGYNSIGEVFYGWKEFIKDLGIFKSASLMFSIEDNTSNNNHLKNPSKALSKS
ncbi:beta-1,3-galactosyltransferase 1-like isoform X1 [Saccostrea echinata]|uniref:beta-1,3-galactosyltransferase 1-like isoform X1 n=1 Tax=Saccostrea echinata TaxID=191078 RepID=UPI002A825F93|nr:beta-1,3-galactosyltransferase 1-like isoform X1 [Saccostrea echinata]